MSTNTDSESDGKNKEVMVRSLLKHLFFDRILPLLPVESALETYYQVESDETFVRCRSVIMDVSINQNINLVVETAVAVVEMILGDEIIISSKLSEDAAQSILVVLRLLSDNLDHYWEHLDGLRMRQREFEHYNEAHERQNRLFTASVIGYSTHRPCFHPSAPHSLDPELAGRLLDICSRSKFNTNTLGVLLGMSSHLYGNTSVVASNILPNYQKYLKQNDFPEYSKKIDRTVDYLNRFVASSNPLEFSRYIRITVLKPLLENHHNIETKIIQYFDLFGCFYITSRNIYKFLETVKGLSNAIRKTIYHCYLILCVSRALQFWIMSRPKDYAFLVRSMKKYSAEISGSGTSNTSSPYLSSTTPIQTLMTTKIHSSSSSSSHVNTSSIYQSHNKSHVHMTTSNSTTSSSNSNAPSSSSTNDNNNNNNNNNDNNNDNNNGNNNANDNNKEAEYIHKTSSLSSKYSGKFNNDNYNKKYGVMSSRHHGNTSNSNGHYKSNSAYNKSSDIHHDDNNCKCDNPNAHESDSEPDIENLKAIDQISSSLFDELYSVFNITNLLSSITNYSSSTPQTTSSSSQQSQSGQTAQQQQSQQFQQPTQSTGAMTGNDPTASTPSSSHPFSSPFSPLLSSSYTSSSTPTNLISSPGSEQGHNISPEVMKTVTGESFGHSFNLDESSIDLCKKNYDIDSMSTLQLKSAIPHIGNILDLYTTLDDNESFSHTAVLRFLIILSLLDADVFVELNATSFKNIPDVKKNNEMIYHSEIDDKEKEREKIQGGIKSLAHGLKKLSILPSSKKRSIKFLTLLLRNLNGSLAISDTALIDTLRSLTTLITLTSSIALIDSDLPSVEFANRLFSTVSNNLDFGKNWPSETKINPFLQKCLLRNPSIFGRLQIEFFAAAIQLNQEKFLYHLQPDEAIKTSNLKRISLYTEGFRIFFQLPSTLQLRKNTALKTSDFFKTLFCTIPDTLLKASPHFDEEVSDIIAAILDGSILREIGERSILRDGVLLTPSPVSLGLVSQAMRTESSSSPSGADNYNGNQNFLSLAANSSSSSETSSINSAMSPSEQQIGNLIAPRARRVSMASSFIRKGSILSSPGTSESDKGPIGSRNQSDAVSNLGLARNTKSPLSQTRSRRASDEGFSKLSRSINLGSISKNVLTTSTDKREDARRIMVNIFSIFKRLASFFILPHVNDVDEAWASADFKNIIKPIFVAIIDSDKNLQKTAQSFMELLINYKPDFEDEKSSNNVRGFYLLSSNTITLFSTALFDLKLPSSKREIVLEIIVKFLQVRYNLSKTLTDIIEEEELVLAEKTTFPLIYGTLGRALFVSLYSNKSSVQKILKTAYFEYLQAIKFYEKTLGELPAAFTDMLAFAEAMSQDNYVASGSVAFQRRLRLNLLKFIKRPDAVYFDAINVIYKRWLEFVHAKDLSQEELADFRSFAGILASMCGVLLFAGDENNSFQYELKMHVTNEMNYFINKQCYWLNNSDLLTRENSKDILSTELHPLAFKLLFENLKPRMNELESVDLTESKNDLLFVLLEQIITIFRTILRREDDEELLLLFSLDILHFIEQLVDIVNNIRQSSPKFFKAVIHMSKMLRAIETSQDSLALRGHYMLKNKWLDLVTNWFNLTLVKEYDFENLHRPHREMDLQRRDLDILFIDTLIESSKALSFLTNNLPLEVPASVSEDELKRSKTVVFGSYFNIFLKGLEKSTDIEKYPASLKHKISILNENVITSLTNLSNANVDAGLSSCLPMGYSKNNNIRIAFLKVFVNILRNYPTYKNKSDKLILHACNDMLLRLIDHPEFALQAMIACPANEADPLAAGFVTAFDSRNASHVFVSQLLVDEIQRAPRHMDILRRNSGATRALSLFSRLKGGKYLEKTLSPVLNEMMESGETFEIEKDSDVQTTYFVKYMTKLVDAITASVPYFPPELFYICQVIYKSVKEKFPDYAYVAVGSFVFLRFFCPALVSPESENVVNVANPKYKRSFISLAKVIQSIANGTDNITKWPGLSSQNDFLKECSNRIFHFLEEICRTDRSVEIPINRGDTPVHMEINFLHKYLYNNELAIRKVIFSKPEFYNNFSKAKHMVFLVDKEMGILGQPRVEFRNEIPSYVIDHMEEYPQLYEFMSRHAFRNVDTFNPHSPFIRESMTSDGFPILLLILGDFNSKSIDIDTVIYRTFQIYARIWPVEHYLLLDCTSFCDSEVDIKKLTSLFLGLIPSIAFKNCKGYFFFNVQEAFVARWDAILDCNNPYISNKVPHYFINSYTDVDFTKSLGISGRSADIIQDVRVSLHDIALFDERNRRFVPVSMKIGNNFFQVLQETTRQYKIRGLDKLIELKFNDVYEISNVVSVNVSSTTGVAAEFTVHLQNGKTLVFCSSKYLEIVKMFYYALDRIEDEYEYSSDGYQVNSNGSLSDVDQKEVKERYELISHLLLVIAVNLLDSDPDIKSVSYNLMAAAQNTFDLDLGIQFAESPEVYVPSDCSAFICLLSRSIANTSPELTLYIWKYILEGLATQIIPEIHVPQTIICLAHWVPNLYQHVYLMDDEEGPEAISRILRDLINITVSNPSFTTNFLQEIWISLAVDGRLTSLVVEEIVNYALDRDSESRDWKKALCLFNGLPTVEVASHIIDRLMKIIKSFLPSFKLEISTQSWSELAILVSTCTPLFFESPLIAQLFLPEVLFIVSLLIDIGPHDIRSSLHELLVNVSHSLYVTDALSKEQKKVLNDVCTTFSRQKLKYMFGFNQDKGRILQNFNSSSFSGKFVALEHFITNIILLMESSSTTESPHWKTRYKKYLIDAVFNSDSFLSARAMMILGIISGSSASDVLCKNLLGQTMKIYAAPQVTEETLFVTIAHIFTYGKLVEGLDPSNNLMQHLFWFSTAVSESINTVIFEGGLLFLSSCLNRLYEVHFEDHNETRLMTSVIVDSRKFAASLLDALEEHGGAVWTEENFSHNLIAVLSRGLSIPFVKVEALDCMSSFFKNTFREHLRNPKSTHYLCYMFLLFLFQSSEQFSATLKDVGLEDDVVVLNENYKLPAKLADWLRSGDSCSSITLYQSALLFNSSISDEPCKLRFALIIRFLIRENPLAVFRIYYVIREELRRISTIDMNSDCVKVSFDIIRLLVEHSEFNDLEKYNERSIQYIKSRGLQSILNVRGFDPTYSNSLANLVDHTDVIYQRKKIITMLLSRMTCYV